MARSTPKTVSEANTPTRMVTRGFVRREATTRAAVRMRVARTETQIEVSERKSRVRIVLAKEACVPTLGYALSKGLMPISVEPVFV